METEDLEACLLLLHVSHVIHGQVYKLLLLLCYLNKSRASYKNTKCAKSKTSPDELSLKGVIADLQLPNTNALIFPVARYPDNHNPLMPLSLQKKLDGMSPKEYLQFVLNELTLEEREALMADEAQRRKTFLSNWPHDKNLSGIRMAQAGFYSMNDYDRVQCVFCRGNLHKLDPDDVPMKEHAKLFAFYRFVKGLECGNKEYRPQANLTRQEMHNMTILGPPTMRQSVDFVSLGISTKQAAHIRYAPYTARIRTYSRWPASSPLNAQTLCDAGFYYTGFDDQVRCFFCAGGLRDWSGEDDPWIEHARWFPDCSYLVQTKSKEFIDEVRATTPEHKKCPQQVDLQRKAESVRKKHEIKLDKMKEVCEKLGHSKGLIGHLVSSKKPPYDEIGDLVDDLHNVENAEEDSSNDGQALDVVSDTNTAQTDGVQRNDVRDDESIELNCWMCKENPAYHVGLPCRHLILCDSCNTELKSQYEAKCPYAECNSVLTATIKVFFA